MDLWRSTSYRSTSVEIFVDGSAESDLSTEMIVGSFDRVESPSANWSMRTHGHSGAMFSHVGHCRNAWLWMAERDGHPFWIGLMGALGCP